MDVDIYVLYCTCTTVHSTAFNALPTILCTALHITTLHCNALHCTALRCYIIVQLRKMKDEAERQHPKGVACCSEQLCAVCGGSVEAVISTVGRVLCVMCKHSFSSLILLKASSALVAALIFNLITCDGNSFVLIY